MRVAVLSESPVDEAAIHILIGGLLGRQTQPVTSLRPPSGWMSVFQNLPVVLKHLYYRTDTEALVVVVDSDNSPVHQQTHDQPGGTSDKCRLCCLREVVAKTQDQLRRVSGRMPVKTAVGLAVPAIEAWYCCGLDPHISEAALLQRPDAGTLDLKNWLKQAVYGTDRPSGEMAIRRATEEATRLSQDLGRLEKLFQNGFGPLARDVRNW